MSVQGPNRLHIASHWVLLPCRPGVNKEDIQVNVDRDVLRINVEKKAEKEEEKEEAGRKYHRWVAVAIGT